ncbi:MAG TPA: pitrilysin family protein, partial [bacterium]|nr:pitrilysin family protein [bacterium]
ADGRFPAPAAADRTARPGRSAPASRLAALMALAAFCLPVTRASAEAELDGPRLVLIPQRSVPMFSCTVLVPAGSALETSETNGSAHYLEHLLFNGTETRTREQIYAEGDLLGAYNNASTQRERTVFQLLLPSENWKQGLTLQADMLLHSMLLEEMFEKEKGIILEELAKDRTSPDYAAQRRTAEILWGDDPRALPTLGTEESIEGMNLEALRTFYRDRYRPGGMTIVLMGDFDEDAALAAIRHLYGTSEAPAPLPPTPSFPSPAATHFRPVEGLGKTRVTVMIPLPGTTSPDYAAAEILARQLNEGERCAVSPAVEEAAGPTQSCSVGLSAGQPWSLLTVSADLPADEGSASEEAAGTAAVGAILRHLGALADGSALSDDLPAAQLGAQVEEISLHEKMHYYGLMRADLLGSPDPSIAEQLPQRIQEVDAPDLARVLRSALGTGDVLAVVLGERVTNRSETLGEDPFGISGRTLPDVPALRAQERAGSSPAAAEVRSPESRRIVFDNGFTLIAKSTPDARTFAAHVLFRDRARREEANGVPRGTSDVVHRMMAIATEQRTEEQLRGALARNAVTLKVTDSDWIPYDDYYFTPEFSYVRLETIDSCAPDALEILADVVLHPRWSEDSFDKAKAAAVARAGRDEATPRSVATNLFLDELGENHPEQGGALGPAADLGELTLEEAKKHHASMIAPDAMTLVVSSNLPVERIEEEVRARFAAGASSPPLSEDAAYAPAGRPTARREAELGREQSWIVVGAALRDVAPADEPALRVAAAVLSERLAEQLREREGLAYSIGAGLRLEGEGAYVRMSAGTRAENLERMEEGMRETAAELTTRPPTDEEIAGARNRGEGRRRMRRLSRMGDAYAMAMAELARRDPLALDADLPALRTVTPADVSRVAAEYFRFDPGIVAVAR